MTDNNFSSLPIDEKKNNLLKEFVRLSSGKSQDEILPLLLAFSQKAKSEHITFTKDDINVIIPELKKGMTKAECDKIETILKMASVL